MLIAGGNSGTRNLLFMSNYNEIIELHNGVIAEREEDLIFGAGSDVVRPDIWTGVNKKDYLPSPERQSSRNFDTEGCVSYSLIETVELNFNRMKQIGLISDKTLKWLTDNGYFIGGELHLSDRFLVVMSNTSPTEGNSGTVVAQYAQTIGLAPQSLCDWNGEGTQAQYYDKSTISQKAIDTAKEWTKYFDVSSDWHRYNLGEWPEASKYGSLQVYTYAWFQKGTKYYNPKPGTSNHAICMCDFDNVQIFDTYEPFIKTLTSWGDCLNFAQATYLKDNNYNDMSNVKIIKDTASPKVYMCLPIADEASFQSYCDNFGIEMQKNADGSTNFSAMIDGSLTLS